MKRISAIVASTFGALIMLSSFATSVRADPTVLITSGAPDGVLFIPVNNLNAMPLCGTCGDIYLINDSDFVINDFHIVISPPLSVPIPGEGFGGFQLTGATNSTIDFDIPSGLRRGDPFTISLIGFPSNTVFFANATSKTPEPITMILLGTGLAGVAIKTRKKLKGRRKTIK